MGVFMNKFRLLRVSITDERSDANYDIVWEDCNADMVIHARDAIQVLYVCLQSDIYDPRGYVGREVGISKL